MNAGARVVRGPDWKWGDQDGGEGFVGTVVKFSTSATYATVQNDTVFVQWDCGTDGMGGILGNYSVGSERGHDLRILDSSGTGIRNTAHCDVCACKQIAGVRWKCVECDDYDLCNTCYHTDMHDLTHKFLRYDLPHTSPVEVPARKDAVKVESFGCFKGATVLRDVADWLQSGQDGGMGAPGMVLAPPPDEWGVVRVMWENDMVFEHQLGRDGVVMVRCLRAESGGAYYCEHLAPLDTRLLLAGQRAVEEEGEGTGGGGAGEEAAEEAEDGDGSDEEGEELGERGSILRRRPMMDFEELLLRARLSAAGISNSRLLPYAELPCGVVKRGDRVRVDMDRLALKILQGEPNAGGWNEEITNSIGHVGRVKGISEDRMALSVEYKEPKRCWYLNRKAVTAKIFKVGDMVRVSEDEAKVKARQKGHGGWTATLKQTLDAVLPVTQVESDGSRLFVKVARCDLQINPWSCCLETPADEAQEEEQEETAGAAGVDVSMEAIRRRLEAGVEVSAPIDARGNTLLHHVVLRGDRPDALELLLERGGASSADLVNFELNSVLHLAVGASRVKCVELLLRRGCNPNLKDIDGDTALHCAVNRGADDRAIIEALLKASNFDFSIVNDAKLTVLHMAALKGHAYAARKIAERAPTLLDMIVAPGTGKELVGSYPVHLAALSGSTKVVDAFVSMNRANLEKKNLTGQHTPLLEAILHRRAETSEFLISAGANVNAQNAHGDTCLHLMLRFLLDNANTEDVIGVQQLDDTTEIKEIYRSVPAELKNRSWVATVCYFALHGADLHRPNNSGATCAQIARMLGDSFSALLEKYQRE